MLELVGLMENVLAGMIVHCNMVEWKTDERLGRKTDERLGWKTDEGLE
jgi:hypothetical protein